MHSTHTTSMHTRPTCMHTHITHVHSTHSTHTHNTHAHTAPHIHSRHACARCCFACRSHIIIQALGLGSTLSQPQPVFSASFFMVHAAVCATILDTDTGTTHACSMHSHEQLPTENNQIHSALQLSLEQSKPFCCFCLTKARIKLQHQVAERQAIRWSTVQWQLGLYGAWMHAYVVLIYYLSSCSASCSPRMKA